MNPGYTYTEDGKLYHVRSVTEDGLYAEVIEDGVGEPGNLDYEPDARVLRMVPVDQIPAETTPVTEPVTVETAPVTTGGVVTETPAGVEPTVTTEPAA